MTDFVYTRREFLRTAAIAGLGLTLPAFLTESIAATTPLGTIPGFKDDRILVVVQLGGGNDGLNTVVPYSNDDYFSARKGLALEKSALLRLDDHLALNGSMEDLKELYDEGGLAIINGVGYPNPNRSHFRSMEIWQTAVDSDRYSDTGWIGRYFDNCCNGTPEPVAGVNVSSETPQAFAGKRRVGVSFAQPGAFKWVEGKHGGSRAAFDALNKVNNGKRNPADTLDFIRHTAANAVISSDKVITASRTKRQMPEYPGVAIGKQLRDIATLIAGGLPTRIYYTSISGFDTHANQVNTHNNLLGQYSSALAAFMKDLKSIGVADRVMVMTFSEFGRRVSENASRGTDHGTAGPVFLTGAGIKPGLHSTYPSLTDLDDGDLKHTLDFRCLYGEILEKWFEADPTKVLGRKFPTPGVVG